MTKITRGQLAKEYLATISGPDVELQSGRILSHLIESAFQAGWIAHMKALEEHANNCSKCGDCNELDEFYEQD